MKFIVRYADLKGYQVIWEKGRYGFNLYYYVPNPQNTVDIVANGECIRAHLPEEVETVVPSPVVEQMRETPYYHEGDHTYEPKTRKCRRKHKVGKYISKRGHQKKNGKRDMIPGEDDHSCEPKTRDRHRQHKVGKHIPKRGHQKKNWRNRKPIKNGFEPLTYDQEIDLIVQGAY